MTEQNLQPGSLVLYKTSPSRINRVGNKKIEIETGDGDTLSVRHKDVTLLHPGPLATLADLSPVKGEINTAWELLEGETTTLSELVELAYGEFTPQTAWAGWQQVADGLFFSGDPDEVAVRTAAAVAAEKEARAAKAAETAAWEAFLARVADGRFEADDAPYLNEVAALAMGQQERSKVLRALNESEMPEHAHAFLLRLGYWDETVNPYPARAGLPVADPEIDVPELPPEERRDLTHLSAFAIDDEGSEDPDDAISWEGGDFPDGRLWVHVADVGALIPPNSPADLEARARGANLYLPEQTVHMLPPQATSMLGLGLAARSPALSFALALNETGEIQDLEIVPSWIQVTRLTYAEAEPRLKERVFAPLAAAAAAFQGRRIASGSVEIDLPEVRIRVVEEAVTIRPLPPLRSRDVVREAMLMTGEAVARFALQNQIPLPFTTQEPPLPADDLPPGLAGGFARRKTMQRSRQSSVPGPHAGLGLPVYVQVTSPLRRYMDMVTHQQLRAFLRGTAVLDEQELMARVGAADAVSGSVRSAERQANAHWIMVYMLRRPQWTGEGVIVEQRGRRTVVLIPELAWDARLYGSGKRSVNETVTVRLQGVDLPNREASFRAV